MAKRKRTKAGTSKANAEAMRAKFVEHYIKLKGNGTEAAIAAGYSPRTAAAQASRLLKDVKVFEAVVERKAQILADLKRETLITEEEVLIDLTRGMRFNPKLLYKPDGSFIPMHELPDELATQLEGAEHEEIFIGSGEERTAIGRTAKVKYPKRVAVREQAMKFFGQFKKHQEQAGRAAGAAAGEAVGRAVADALDFDAIEKRVAEKLRARRRPR